MDTSIGSDSYMWAESLAVELELFEQQASATSSEILPDKASYSLDRHGAVEGLTPNAATKAVLQVTITGTSGATLTLTGQSLQASDGATYNVSANADGTGTSIVLSGTSGTGYATAQIAGAAGTKPVATVLTWSSAPTGANPTATVAATTVAGTDVESNASYAARIIARRQDRPASGNRADWQTWATAVAGVADAVVYPLWHPTYGTGTLGAVTVVTLGPVQGASATNTRIVSGTVVSDVAGYVEGTHDANGVAGSFTQLRPATMAAGDYTIAAATTLTQDVELQVTLATAYAAPWLYNAVYTVTASTTTTLALSGDLTGVLKPSGTPLAVLVRVATTAARGGYVSATPATVTFDGVHTNLTFAPALPAAPVTSAVVLPGLPNWPQLQTAVFDYFDGLGPGDTSPASRWPTEDVRLRSRLYVPALVSSVVQTAAGGVPGVLSCTALSPSADILPLPGQIVTLGKLSIHT